MRLWDVLWPVLGAALAVFLRSYRAPARRLVRALNPVTDSAPHPGTTATPRGWSPRRWFVRKDPTDGPVDVAELAERLAALARAGLPTPRSWQILASVGGEGQQVCRSVAELLSAGGSVAEGLRAAERVHGLPWLAAAQRSAERTGAPMAQVLDAFARGIREDERAVQERATALAGPRATATVLGVLPVLGMVLGFLLGANPLATLVFTGVGRGCLVLGAGLWFLGWWWSKALISRAERAGDDDVP